MAADRPGLLDAVVAAQGDAQGYQPSEIAARAAVEAVAAWLETQGWTMYSEHWAAALRAEVAPPTDPRVDLIVEWMQDGKATGTAQGDAEQLLDLLADAGFTLERKP